MSHVILAQGDIEVFLTSNAIPHLRLLSRHVALMAIMLRAAIGSPVSPDFPEQLAEEYRAIEGQRLQAIGIDPVVVIKITGDIEAEIPVDAREIEDFVICFNACDGDALRARLQPNIAAVLTALRVGTNCSCRFRKIAEGSYLTTGDGRVVHSASMKAGSVDAYVSVELTPEQCTQVASDMALTLSAGPLERVMRLHAHSLNRSVDNYRAFVYAWSALEILIGKLFPVYQSLLRVDMRAVNQAPGLQAYLDRVEKVMGSRHSLVDKFAVLAAYLDGERDRAEVKTFHQLKVLRDRLSHGEEIDEGTLPTKEVQRYFEKYLRNHLRRNA